MKKGIMRIFALCLVLAMMFVSLTSCKKDEKGATENSSSTPTAASQESQTDDTSSPDGDELESEPGDLTGTIEGGDDWMTGITVTRPYTDGQLSEGVKLGLGDSGIIDDEDDPFDEEGEWDTGADIEEEVDEEVYTPFVQKVGPKASGATREITVNNSEVLFEGWYGLNANCFPTQFTYDAQTAVGDIPAYAELNAKRYNEMTGAYMRSWFQIDWIITNELEEAGKDFVDYRGKWDSNPDYANYKNGIYDFDNDAINSAIEYWRMLEEADTEVYLAYGWKVATRIQDWFGNNPQNQQIAAPRELDLYAKACVALFKYCRKEAGLTNFNTLSFYNEPDRADDYTYQGSWDFQTLGNKCVVWAKMVEECHKALEADPDTQDVRIMVADCSNDINIRTDNYVNVYLRNYATEYFTDYTFHCYPNRYNNMGSGNTYSALFDSLLKAYHYYNDKPRWITEYYTTSKDIPAPTNGEDGYDWDGAYNGWNCSAGAYICAAAHNGFSGLFKWSWVGGYLLDPLKFDPANGSSSNWIRAIDGETISQVHYSFYEESMLNNYIRDNSNVHFIEWIGDDIRAAAFTSEDGKDFSLMVETNEDSIEKDLKVKLTKSLGGKTINVFRYTWDVEKNAQASLIPCSDTIEGVGSSFTYHTDDKYGVYVFTTYKPMDCLEVYEPGTENDRVYYAYDKENDASVTIEPRFTDNYAYSEPSVSKSTMKWEIKQYSEAPVFVKQVEQQIVRREKIAGADLGTLTVNADGSATYVIPDDAKVGDVIALRVSYKNDPDRFSSVIVEVF